MSFHSPALTQPRVLVVEPDPSVLRLVELALQRAQMWVETADCESAALACCARQDFQVVVAGLAPMRALQLMSKLDKSRPAPALLILNDGYHIVSSELPVLEKPFGLDDLRNRIRQLIA